MNTVSNEMVSVDRVMSLAGSEEKCICLRHDNTDVTIIAIMMAVNTLRIMMFDFYIVNNGIRELLLWLLLIILLPSLV